jgi:hypothetical protein
MIICVFDICRKYFLHRNKIPLPLNQARCLFGIADETGTLKPGECFIQRRELQFDPWSKTYLTIEGIILTLQIMFTYVFQVL